MRRNPAAPQLSLAPKVLRVLLVPVLVPGLVLGTACSDSGKDSAGKAPGVSGAGSSVAEQASPDDTASPDRRRRGSSSVPEVELLEARPYASEGLGALHGFVRFEGEPPERFPLGARQKTECTHFPEVEHLSDIAVVIDGKVQYTYVYLKSGFDEAAIPPPPADDVLMDQRGCMYLPHVVALQKGQKLLVKNSDPTNHNVHVYDGPKNDMNRNRNMGPGQDPIVFETRREEHGIRFKCDIHPWMEARAYVEEHPWFAVTDEEGAFEIPDVPPGDYVVEAIHETFGTTRGKVTVTAGSSTGFTLTLSE